MIYASIPVRESIRNDFVDSEIQEEIIYVVRRFKLLLGWIGFIILVSLILHFTNSASRESDQDFESFSLIQENPVIQKIQQAYQKHDYVTALQLLDKHEIEFANLPESDYQAGYQFYLLKGFIHSSVWQHIEAEQSWEKAGVYATNHRLKARLARLIKASRHVINDINSERNLRTYYQASPYVGPASVLRGKVVVLYVFLTDSALQNWSLRKRDFVMTNWQLAQRWIQKSAKIYASDVSFTHRLFVVDRNPYIKRMKVADFDGDFVNSDKVAQLVAENFGYDNILAFIDDVKKQENADQAILLLHLARDGRSFASRCMYRCQSDAEYVFLMEQPKVKFWQSMGYAQAHESLHLFGADDLYNIRKAKFYAVRDIMNYPSSLLDANTMDEITAYAIGLIDKQPETPFKIIDYTPARE
jgi:hypothetical protein